MAYENGVNYDVPFAVGNWWNPLTEPDAEGMRARRQRMVNPLPPTSNPSIPQPPPVPQIPQYGNRGEMTPYPQGPSPIAYPQVPVQQAGAVPSMPTTQASAQGTGIFVGGQQWTPGMPLPGPQMIPDVNSPEYKIQQSRAANGMPQADFTVPQVYPQGQVTNFGMPGGQQVHGNFTADQAIAMQQQQNQNQLMARPMGIGSDRAAGPSGQKQLDPQEKMLRDRAMTDPHSMPPALRKQVLDRIQQDTAKAKDQAAMVESARRFDVEREKGKPETEKEKIARENRESREKIEGAKIENRKEGWSIKGEQAIDQIVARISGSKELAELTGKTVPEKMDFLNKKAEIEEKKGNHQAANAIWKATNQMILKEHEDLLKGQITAGIEASKSFTGKPAATMPTQTPLPETIPQPQSAAPVAGAQQIPTDPTQQAKQVLQRYPNEAAFLTAFPNNPQALAKYREAVALAGV